MKVLIVDDNRDILQAVRMVMDAEGHETLCLNTGAQVYEKIKSFQPDMIILDYLLSGYDGREICKDLKSRKDTQKIPVMIISAHPKVKDTIKDYGADSFLAKPFSVSDLINGVKNLV